MNPRQLHSHHEDHNMFLTATASHQHPLTPKISHHHSPSRHIKLLQNSYESHQTIRNCILVLIKEFKALHNSPQISHLFNEILYGLDGSIGEKKSIQKIAELLQNERNIIKLNRVWNRLKALKKQFDRLGLDKQQKAEIRTNYSKKNSYSKIKANQPLSSSNTFHKGNGQQVNELKENIIEEISYRERLNKIQSQRQKHEENRQKYLQKKLAKAKQMNKKVKDVYEKKKTMQKQQYSNHKYEMLYDPEQERLKKRGKTMNFKRKQQEASATQNDTPTANIRSNERSVTMKLQSQEGVNRSESRLKKNLKFSQKQDERYTKQDLKTFKSLKQLINQNIKGSKSFKALTKNQSSTSKDNMFNLSKPRQLYTKIQDTSLNRSHSLGKNQTFNGQKSKILQEQKLTTAMSKRIELEEERLRKIITQAVVKQKKILQIYQRKTLGKPKKAAEDSQQELTHMNSLESSPSKSYFKKVYTRKELLDKEKKIFAQIQNKLQKKQNFLQERVDKVRERLRKEEMIKQKHKQAWDEYIQFSENCSINNSRSMMSPQNKEKENLFKRQERLVKNSHFTKLKKMQSMTEKEKLASLTMQQLKKKLAEIDAEEEEKKKLQQRIIF